MSISALLAPHPVGAQPPVEPGTGALEQVALVVALRQSMSFPRMDDELVLDSVSAQCPMEVNRASAASTS